MGSIGATKPIVHKRTEFFQQELFNKLPKKLQVDNIIDIEKEKTDYDGIRYEAIIEFDDGFQRSISEYGWSDFKYYLENVLKDRNFEQ